MPVRNKTKWCIPVTKNLDDALEHAVKSDSHSSKSEFVRDAVRRRLETMGFNPQVFEKKLEASVTPRQENHASLVIPTVSGGNAV